MKVAYSVTLEQQPAPCEVKETIIRRGVPVLLDGWDAAVYRLMRIIEMDKERKYEDTGISESN